MSYFVKGFRIINETEVEIFLLAHDFLLLGSYTTVVSPCLRLGACFKQTPPTGREFLANTTYRAHVSSKHHLQGARFKQTQPTGCPFLSTTTYRAPVSSINHIMAGRSQQEPQNGCPILADTTSNENIDYY
ncbi:hypothetical protein PoB_005190700 [Plakobranchus ocellatus]|uniref:Uncharacterized protein n=1 Tax=Plakobranchus ocellatus TaxID=259542 RepID=A0AAV4C223_9GAST|nr:hypothetical protein PoB_005190700 [Plakobranchus ocellatus]